MPSYSYTLRRGETLAEFVKRDNPNGGFMEAREIAPNVVGCIIEGPAEWAPFAIPTEGKARFAGVAIFRGGFVKYMEQDLGPYHDGRFPPDMLAMLSPMQPDFQGYARNWLERQTEQTGAAQ
jgi:hypothetical protein